MNTAARSLGSHVYFFREGSAFTVPGAGTASRTAKPDGTDPAWIDFGIVNNLAFAPTSNVDEIFAPSPGALELYDIVENKRKLDIKFDAEELSFLSFELAFRTKPLTLAGGVYNPGAGAPVKGWFRIEQFDQNADDNSTPTNVVDLYGFMKLESDLKCDENHVKTGIMVTKLVSALNAGTLIA